MMVVCAETQGHNRRVCVHQRMQAFACARVASVPGVRTVADLEIGVPAQRVHLPLLTAPLDD